MALETGKVYVDSKTVATAGTPEALTTREIRCGSVFILPKSANTGDVELCDNITTSQQLVIPASGITLPINDPASILIDVTVNGEGVDWVAV